jgi:hypothetical protein
MNLRGREVQRLIQVDLIHFWERVEFAEGLAAEFAVGFALGFALE